MMAVNITARALMPLVVTMFAGLCKCERERKGENMTLCNLQQCAQLRSQ
jgi:hypothetical protein